MNDFNPDPAIVQVFEDELRKPEVANLIFTIGGRPHTIGYMLDEVRLGTEMGKVFYECLERAYRAMQKGERAP